MQLKFKLSKYVIKEVWMGKYAIAPISFLFANHIIYIFKQ